jgi:F-type H+-transporting ATPase subunit delta
MEPGIRPIMSESIEQLARQQTVLDVNTQRVARVYAEAWLEAAGARGQTEEVLAELGDLLNQVFKADPHFEAFLTSGIIDRHRKAEVLSDAFAGRAGELVLNGLLVLNEHDRLNLLRPIVQTYRELRDQQAGRMRVEVASAIALPEDARARLLQELRQKYDKEPILETRVDPELLGGMVVRIGDQVYDQSVRTQLNNIRNEIIARSSYEIQSGRDRFSSPNGD